jgi:DNA replication and repair protein RecF
MGKSFRAERESEMIRFRAEVCRVCGKGEVTLEVVLTVPSKKFLLNGVSKRRVDVVGQMPVVLFSPLDLETIIGPPTLRRRFLDGVLEQVNRDYRVALSEYTKALRQRNKLLERARDTGQKDKRQFAYWDELLIRNGEVITKGREGLITFLNSAEKEVFDFAVFYDKSLISEARLAQYEGAEVQAAATLVGPHRDDFWVSMFDSVLGQTHDVSRFGSRGQQRLSMLELKLLELRFIERSLSQEPILLLDDIFSELDSEHIDLVLTIIGKQQTIITTTHAEFVDQKRLRGMTVVELEKTT